MGPCNFYQGSGERRTQTSEASVSLPDRPACLWFNFVLLVGSVYVRGKICCGSSNLIGDTKSPRCLLGSPLQQSLWPGRADTIAQMQCSHFCIHHIYIFLLVLSTFYFQLCFKREHIARLFFKNYLLYFK